MALCYTENNVSIEVLEIYDTPCPPDYTETSTGCTGNNPANELGNFVNKAVYPYVWARVRLMTPPYSSRVMKINISNVNTQAVCGQAASADVSTGQILGAISGSTTAVTNTVNNSTTSINNNIRSSRDFLENVIETSNQQVVNAVSGSMGNIGATISNATNVINNNTNNGLANVDNSIRQSQGNILNSIAGTGQQILSSAAITAQNIVGIIGFATEDINAVTNAVGSEIQGGIDNAVSSVEDTIANVEQSVLGFVNDILQGISDAIQGIIDEVERIYNEIKDGLESWFKRTIQDPLKYAGNRFESIFDAINGLFSDKYADWSAFIRELLDNDNTYPVVKGLFDFIFAIPTIMRLFYGAGGIYSERILTLLYSEVTPKVIDESVLIKLRKLELISAPIYFGEMRKNGYNEQNASLMLGAADQSFSVNELFVMYLRGLIDENTLNHRLIRVGINIEDIDKIKGLIFQLPPIQDLIRFAVREVFSPEIANRFGLFEDYPTQLTEFAKQQGYSEQWAKSYWAAHWDLPSPNMGFEMYQRGIITIDDLRLLLRALDVMPYWRDKLIQLAYNPVTRVDIRRMYDIGVIDLDEVYKRHLHLGYAPDDARLMSEFVRLQYPPEGIDDTQTVRELTRTVIEKAFIRRILTLKQAKDRLIDLGYKPNDAELLLQLADYNNTADMIPDRTKELNERLKTIVVNGYKKRAIDRQSAVEYLLTADLNSDEIELELDFADLEYSIGFKQSVVNAIKDLYVGLVIDRTEAYNIFNQYDFVDGEIQVILAELDIEKDIRTKKPTLTQFTEFVVKGIITADEYIEELKGLGFADKYIEMIVALELGSE